MYFLKPPWKTQIKERIKGESERKEKFCHTSWQCGRKENIVPKACQQSQGHIGALTLIRDLAGTQHPHPITFRVLSVWWSRGCSKE